MEEIDIHNQMPRFEKEASKITQMAKSKNKELLEAYVRWHRQKIEQGSLAYSSAWRSLSHALKLCDYFEDISLATQEQVEKWFAEQINKEAVVKTSTGYLKPAGRKRSAETIEDIATQGEKFFKFVRFMEKGKPLELFNSRKCPIPEVCQFLSVDTSTRKVYEKPKVSQEQIKTLIEHLRSKGEYLSEQCGTLAALLNDTGMRFSEACTLRHKNISIEGDYLVISIKQSKTRTRTVCSVLAKPYLQTWISKSPTKNDPAGLIFCTRKGTKVNYGSLRHCFNKAIEELGIEWHDRSSFHYLRHIFASRASQWSDFLIKYWLGWHDRSMRAHYSEFAYKDCLPYYLEMVKDNPMLKAPLSYLEEKEAKTIEDKLKADITAKVIAMLKAEKALA